MPNDSRRVVESYYDRLNDHDVDGAGALLAPDCAVTVADVDLDREVYLEVLRTWMAAFPDLRNTLDEVLADGPTVMVRATWEGTHEGPFLGAPSTGRRVTFGSFSSNRVENGWIAERQILANVLGVLQQIGDLSWSLPASDERDPGDLASQVTAAFRGLTPVE